MNEPQELEPPPFSQEQPRPVPEPSKSEVLLLNLNEQITTLQKQVEWVQNHRESLDAAPKKASFCCEYIDFDRLEHQQVLEVVKLFGGKWDKNINGDNQSIDYVADVEGQKVRCWSGKPPPQCQIVEIEVEMPAIPAHKETVRKIVCRDESQSV